MGANMRAVALELFQGLDWMTYRPAVASALTLLDDIHNVCSPQTRELEIDPANTLQDIIDTLGHFDVAMDTLAADLMLPMHKQHRLRWAAEETRLLTGTLRDECRNAQVAFATKGELHARTSFTIAERVDRIKDLIKEIDGV